MGISRDKSEAARLSSWCCVQASPDRAPRNALRSELQLT